ncbi:metallophosphoesterase family protein [Methylosinus sp. LW4]|uniref:metallophosphoesterase family protein n=1 Tax=Methylosinus sp. LW4 TaxID=136993 RepID=UPI000382050B|nr:DNA repair exonuclease [Methylosinus sp. LW4]
MRFCFLHAADLHIDSPLAGLGVKDPAVAARFAQAGRRAVEALIDEAISADAAFVVISGDIFDGDWKDVTTGLFFARALGRLDRKGIPTFIVKGNHDADSLMSKSLPYPPSVRIFSSARAETLLVEQRRVALHGRSFGTRLVDGAFVASYPERREGWLNIGVLHTALDGSRGHAAYAPCTVEDLARFGYDYWALGHVHAAEIVARDPWIVYPGNIQGRSVKETGAKGAMRITVDDGRIVEATPVSLDAARWAHESVEIDDCADEAAALARIEARLGAIHAQAEARPLAARVRLVGATPLHERLVAGRETLEQEARALGFRLAEDCWVEKLEIATRPPARARAPAAPDALDIETLLREAAADPGFEATLAELAELVGDKLPRGLRAEFPADPAALAQLAETARDLLLGALEQEDAA